MALPVGTIVSNSAGVSFLVETTTKRQFPDAGTLAALTLGAPPTTIVVTDAALAAVTTGAPFPTVAAYAQANPRIATTIRRIVMSMASGGLQNLAGGMMTVVESAAALYADAMANPAGWAAPINAASKTAPLPSTFSAAATRIIVGLLNNVLNRLLNSALSSAQTNSVGSSVGDTADDADDTDEPSQELPKDPDEKEDSKEAGDKEAGEKEVTDKDGDQKEAGDKEQDKDDKDEQEAQQQKDDKDNKDDPDKTDQDNKDDQDQKNDKDDKDDNEDGDGGDGDGGEDDARTPKPASGASPAVRSAPRTRSEWDGFSA